MIEVLMQVRKDRYKDNPILPEGLDLVEEDDQITHQIQLEEELQVQEGLSEPSPKDKRDCANTYADIFKTDPKYVENEEKYKSIKAEILGEDSDEDEDSDASEEDEEEEDAEGSWITNVSCYYHSRSGSCGIKARHRGSHRDESGQSPPSNLPHDHECPQLRRSCPQAS